MDAADDSERNDAASPSSPIPANPHHTTLMSSSKKPALARALDCDSDSNEFAVAMDHLPRKKLRSFTIQDTSTAKPLEPGNHAMITATVSAPSITSSCHVEPSSGENDGPPCYLHCPWDDPEATRKPCIESAPPQKLTATDSSSAENALPEFFLQDLKCSVCDHGFAKTRSGWFHCSQCSTGIFVLCRTCYTNDKWCYGDTHTLDQWVFPIGEGEKLNMPDEYIPEFFFRVEKSIRRFRSAHTLPTCTTYSLLSPEDSILLEEERLQYKGSVTCTVVDHMPTFPVSDYLFGPVRSMVQLTKNLRALSIDGLTEVQMEILELFEETKYDDVDAIVFSSANSGKSTAVLLGLIMKASIKNDKAAIAYRSLGDFGEAQGRSCRAPFAIIVCPTRDLAIEIFRKAWYLCCNTNFKPVLSIDGNDDLTVGDILIGTTGKLNRIATDRMIGPAQYVVIEQASDMLQDCSRRVLHRLLYDNGAADCNTKFRCLFGDEDFTTDIKQNYKHLIGSVAWYGPDHPRYITPDFDTEPFTGELVHQHFLKFDNPYMDLVSRLTKALYRNDKVRAVIFTETAEDCDVLEDLLSRRIDDGVRKVRARSNNMSPRQQEVNVESLKRGQCQILVTTGSLALGVKMVNVTHVIHFMLPRDKKKDKSKLFAEYLQRIGMGGLSDYKVTSWAYYDEKDEKLFTLLADYLVELKQATWVEEVLWKFENGETIMPH